MEVSGIVFDIRRCALHNGPGIRTVVFLKGCPLNCVWCHIPESIVHRPQISFDRERCNDCLACVAVCPHGAHQAQAGVHRLDFDRCQVCGTCVTVCESGALALIGKEMSVSQVLDEVLPDSAHCRRSGGGITLSGGEPMVQFRFARALVAQAKAHGIHTCLETRGLARPEPYAKILPHVDLFLFDYKATDACRHKALTGVSNGRILANLDFLYRRGASIVLRCPLVPDVNDDPAHLAGIAQLAAKYPDLVGIELVISHDWNREKGVHIGREPAREIKTASPDKKDEWLEGLRLLGCSKVRIV